MVKRHLSRLAAPLSWPIKRKGIKFITRSNPGPHSLESGIPLNILVKNLLGYAKITMESKIILNKGEVLIDKKQRKDHKFPVGLMDIIEIPKLKEKYTLVFNERKKLCLKKIKTDDKICKIGGKRILKGGKTQLNLYDGRNILVEKDGYRVGDSVVLDLKNNKIIDNLKLEKGALVYITGGKYIGKSVVVEKLEKGKIFCKGKEGIQIPKKYAFVINKELFEK